MFGNTMPGAMIANRRMLCLPPRRPAAMASVAAAQAGTGRAAGVHPAAQELQSFAMLNRSSPRPSAFD